MTRERLLTAIKQHKISTEHFAPHKRQQTSVFDNTELLKQAVQRSKSRAEVVRRMGMSVSGASYKILQARLFKHNISTDHFDPYSAGYERKRLSKRLRKIALKDILTKNSTYDRKDLKKRLVEECRLDYKCAKCENGGIWQGETLTLQLEHKNGVNNDNRLQNLEFLCPNCHSQTATYAGRNSKKH